MNKYRFHISVIFSIAALLACFGVAQAQKQASVAITPAIIDVKVKRGSSYTQDFTVNNSTGVRLRFRCSVEDIWYDELNKRLSGRSGTLPRSATLWTQISPSEVVVEPNSSAVIKVVITIPQGASGSFYTVPVFEGLPADKTAATNSQVNNSAATIGVRFRGLIMLTTTEGSEYNVEIMGGRITPPTASTELQINLDLRNRGTAHAKVRGAYAILNSAGTLAGRGTIGEKTFLPTQRKSIDSRWSGELPPGSYVCVATLSYNRVGLEPSSLIYEIPFTVK